MKKLLTMVILLIVVGCFAFAAGGKESSQTGGTVPELLWYTIGTPQRDQEEVNKAISAITREKIGADLKVQTIDWGSFNDRLRLMMASQERFDLCFTSSWANEYTAAVAKGGLLPLDDLLASHGSAITRAIPRKYLDAIRAEKDGKIYAIPNYQIMVAYNGVLLRKDLVEKYKFDYKAVRKLEDLEPFFAQVKAGEPDIVPFLTQGGDLPLFNLDTGYTLEKATASWNIPLYISVNDPGFKVFNIKETPEYRQRVNLLSSWYAKGYIRKDASAIKDYIAERKTGKYAAYTAGTLKPGIEAEDKAANGYEVVAVPIAPAYTNAAFVTSTMTGISITSKNPELAMKVLDLIYQDKDLYNLLCFGIEGKHHRKLPGGYADPIPDGGYNPSTDWVFGNQFNAYLRPGMQADVWEKTIKLNNDAIPSPLIGFNFDREAVKTEAAQVEAIIDEYSRIDNNGVLTYDQFVPEMNERLKKAGLDKLMAELQRQIDAWKTRK